MAAPSKIRLYSFPKAELLIGYLEDRAVEEHEHPESVDPAIALLAESKSHEPVVEIPPEV